MNRTLLTIIMLCIAGASAAQDVKPSAQDALSLHLRRTSDGKPAGDTLTYKVTDRAYDNVLRHLGGLSPGETKQFRPWKD
jgi:hypothetical protein